MSFLQAPHEGLMQNNEKIHISSATIVNTNGKEKLVKNVSSCKRTSLESSLPLSTASCVEDCSNCEDSTPSPLQQLGSYSMNPLHFKSDESGGIGGGMGTREHDYFACETEAKRNMLSSPNITLNSLPLFSQGV